MKNLVLKGLFPMVVVCLSPLVWAQSAVSPSTAETPSVVPTLVNYSGVLTDSAGNPLSEITGVTFLLYKDHQGGAPLWLETQNIRPDSSGHYTVTLGATDHEGLPADLFANGEARWLAVQVSGQTDQERVLLVAVPYAMKAKDAETIGGLPPSAFMLANSAQKSNFIAGSQAAGTDGVSGGPAATANVTTTGGSANAIPLFTTATNIQSSELTQTGTGAGAMIGIGMTTPTAKLDVNGGVTVRGQLGLPKIGNATVSAGAISQPLVFVASSLDSSTNIETNQIFQWQAEPAENNTASPSGTLNLLYGLGTAARSETGLKINAKGIFTFASGQTFPGSGTGTVTTVGSGPGLIGGPITTSGVLSIATAGVSNAMLAHPSLTVAPGAGLTGGGSVALGGTTTLNLDTSKVPQLGANNTFTGNQSITGNLNVIGNVGVGTSAPTQKLEVDLGNAMVKGLNNFKKNGDTAALYVGDTNHPVEALYNSGLAIGAYRVPNAFFIQDTTGNVGIGTTAPTAALTAITANASLPAAAFDNAASGQILSLRNAGVEKFAVQNNGIVQVGTASSGGMLNIVSPSLSLVGLAVTGWSAPSFTYMSGSTAVVASGGSADYQGGPTTGGAGVIAAGGGGGIDGQGGAGISASGGAPSNVGGVGGSFAGANGRDGDGDGIDASGGNLNGNAYAGNFSGDINVSGTIFAGTKDFRIDHPLDPANKYLVHASVESSEMKNIYDGMITLGGGGEAEVNLPEWFEALNGDFRYQLTAIGRSSPGLYISEEISGNHFHIAGGIPGTKVSWQVTGVRKDAYAKATPLVVEQVKSGREQGFYIHPELFGAPQERGIEWARNPAWMQHVKELRAKESVAFLKR